MSAILLVFLAAWVTIRIATGTPIALACRRMLVDAPARAINRIARGHILTAVVLVAFGSLLIWQLEGDGVRLLSLMAPEIVSWLTMFEISTYLDALVTLIAVSATLRPRGIVSRIAARVSRPPSRRAGRARRSRAATPPAANDDDGPAEPMRRAA